MSCLKGLTNYVLLKYCGEILIFNFLKPGGYFTYHQVQHSESVHGPDNVVHIFCLALLTNSNFCYILH